MIKDTSVLNEIIKILKEHMGKLKKKFGAREGF